MNSAFLKACRGEPTDHTPIWLHRQAGRYMRDYHVLKGDTPSLTFFTTPELAARAALDAQRILGVDAAIVFADLLPMLIPMGLTLDYKPGVGPVFERPLRSAADVDRLATPPAEEATPYIAETIRRTLADLPRDVPLIGFAGAPFTLAAYAIEGQSSRNFEHVKRMMYAAPAVWHGLMAKLVDAIAGYVALQIGSGAHAIQLFDSWVGCLSLADYERYVMPHSRRLIARLGGRVPVIYFGTGNGHLVDAMHSAGPDVMALDWRTPLAATWRRLGAKAVQGNMDPVALTADPATVVRHAKAVLDDAGGRPGHIFNLGHGVLPTTPVDNVKRLVDFVHAASAR